MKAAQGGEKLLPHVLISSITGQECVPLQGEDECLWERLQSIVLIKDVPSNMEARTLQVKLRRAVLNDLSSKEKKKQLWAFNNRNAKGSREGKEGQEGSGEEKSNRSTTKNDNEEKNTFKKKRNNQKTPNEKEEVPFGIVRLHRAYGRPFEYNSDDSDDGIEHEEAKRIKAEGKWCFVRCTGVLFVVGALTCFLFLSFLCLSTITIQSCTTIHNFSRPFTSTY